MCDRCNNQNNKHENLGKNRREFLKTGAILPAAPVLTGVSSSSQASSETQVRNGPYAIIGYGATSATSPLKVMNIEHRALSPDDILIDLMYCGVCPCREKGRSLPLCN
jgi:uncharacterized zinc-type alcohol dehydrogenase-like protein